MTNENMGLALKILNVCKMKAKGPELARNPGDEPAH